MSKPTADQVRFAVAAFLNTMRRESVKRHGESRVPEWDTLTLADKQIILRAVLAALTAKAPEGESAT